MSAAPTINQPTAQLQQQFLILLPRIELHARILFRDVRCAARQQDAVQECVALAWKRFLRLHEQGKDINDFVTVFVSLVGKAVKSGRRLTGMLNAQDVLNERCQRKHGFTIETLATASRATFDAFFVKPHGQVMHDAFEERLSDNRLTPVPDQVAFRVDWPEFFTSLPTRDQQMAAFLSLGNNARTTSAKFGLSPGRVTQLRQRWCQDWQGFQDADVLA